MLLLHKFECTVELVWEVTGQWTPVKVNHAVVLVGLPLQLAVLLVGPGKPGTGKREEEGDGRKGTKQ